LEKVFSRGEINPALLDQSRAKDRHTFSEGQASIRWGVKRVKTGITVHATEG
jgi:hypothetical protein